jgi:hypothetical protein
VGDAVERCRRFYGLMSRAENKVLSPTEVQARHVEHGLNRTSNHDRRMDLWNSMHGYFDANFVATTGKRMPSLDGFAAMREPMAAFISTKVDTSGLGFWKSKGKGKRVFKKITADELTAVLYPITLADDKYGEAFLGYEDAALVYKQLLGRSASPNRISCIFKALKGCKLLSVGQPGSWADGTATVYVPHVRLSDLVLQSARAAAMSDRTASGAEAPLRYVGQGIASVPTAV